MNPIWILVALLVLWVLANIVADTHEERRASADDTWRGDRREELRSVGVALLIVPLFPLGMVVALPEILTTGRPVWWAVVVGGSLLWLIGLAILWREDG